MKKYFNVLDKIETKVVCSVKFSENGTLYKTMWKNIVDPDGPQII